MSKLTTQQIVESLKEYSLLEINSLVKEIEVAFNVSASFAVASAPAGDEAKSELPTEQNLHLVNAGTNKIGVIKLIREVTGLGLMDAKKLVDVVPSLIKEAFPTSQAEEIKKKFSDVGATIEFK